MISIVGNRKMWYGLSGALVLLSLLSLGVWGLRLGIDFTGGSLLEVQFENRPAVSQVRDVLQAKEHSVQVQESGEKEMIIRTGTLSEQQHQDVLDALREMYGSVTEQRFDSIGPSIGKDLQKTAGIGVVLTLVLISLYIAWAFRKVTHPVASWKYGVLTIIAAFHDILITIGVFSVLGHFLQWEVDAAFVAAILTVLGYAINDRIVVFDRTRENLARHVGHDFAETVEISIRQTLRRSFYTGMSALLALLSIFLFGGDTTKPFALALIVGIVVGTYASVFVASPLLVTWEKWRSKK